MEDSGDDGKAEMARQILMTFNEIKTGVGQLQKSVEEIVSGFVELNASLQEIGRAVQVLAGESSTE